MIMTLGVAHLGLIRVIVYDGLRLQVVKVTSPRPSFATGPLNWSLENHTPTHASKRHFQGGYT